MTLLIDNYDSFSYNPYQLIGELNPDIRVIRNDEMTLEEIRALKPDRIILSPGPGRPEDAGIIVDAARELGRDIPLLGVCLGHQAICAAFGVGEPAGSLPVDVPALDADFHLTPTVLYSRRTNELNPDAVLQLPPETAEEEAPVPTFLSSRSLHPVLSNGTIHSIRQRRD